MGRNSAKTIVAEPVSKASDLYSWARRQSELLRAGRLPEVDAEALAEEIDDVGEEQYYRLESALRVLMLHLLKWDHQASARNRSWSLTVREQRRRVERLMHKNPGLKSRLDEAMREAYEDARDDAAAETTLALGIFPAARPYDLNVIMGRPVVRPGDEE